MGAKSVKKYIITIIALVFIPAAFAWTFVPFYKLFGWYEYAFKARLFQRIAVSVLGFGTLCLALCLLYIANYTHDKSGADIDDK